MTAAPRGAWRPMLAGLLLGLAFVGFIALGNWQVHRRAWKLDLIARVDARLQAEPIPAPARAEWPTLNKATHEYLKVCADGVYLHDRETLVQAVTRLGPGRWLLTPLQQADGSVVLVNRGYVDEAHYTADTRRDAQAQDAVHVCGLLRLSEPGGAFLRRNAPTEGRWYSRDTAAIAAARGLVPTEVAPYFIDADATPNPGSWPVGGLTVVQFPNSHLVYAITWYGLALMTAAALVALLRHERARRRAG